MKNNITNIVIIGAGPSGLACSNELMFGRNKLRIVCLEKNDRVGGLARSYYYRGSIFDIGPHRFYTKNAFIFSMWKKLLKNSFLRINRKTRIYYKNIFFHYPINIMDILKKFDLKSLVSIFFSYIKAQIYFFNKTPKTYQEWIEKKFGYILFNMFFQDYTVKVWGIACNKISAVWAQSRIDNLDFFMILRSFIPFRSSSLSKSLSNIFYYPQRGSGYFFQKLADSFNKKDIHIELRSQVQKIIHSDSIIKTIIYTKNGKTHSLRPDFVFSSMPITKLIFTLSPPPPYTIMQAASRLKFRGHITVNILIKRKIFPDNWVYIHDPLVKMARITNYNSFNPSLQSNDHTAISIEYFAFKEEKIWLLSEEELIMLAKNELQKIGMILQTDILKGFVIKEEDAYPAYYMGYERYLSLLTTYVSTFKNLKCIGRGGMYKYNNMDQAMLSGIDAAKEYITSAKTSVHRN